MIDTHSHILPGLDDGVRDVEEALAVARLAVEDGIEGIVCTPHWVSGVFENTRTVVMKAMAGLKAQLEKNDIPLALYPGTELRIDFEMAEKIREGLLLTLNDSGRYALVELPADVVPPGVEGFFRRMRTAGLIPIVAHPERNPVLIHNPRQVFDWVSSGVLIQLTARSLLGKFGGPVRRFSEQLVEHRLIHLVATDTHGAHNRGPRLSAAAEKVARILGEEETNRIFLENPLKILRGERLAPLDSVPFKKRTPFPKKLFPFLVRGR